MQVMQGGLGSVHRTHQKGEGDPTVHVFAPEQRRLGEEAALHGHDGRRCELARRLRSATICHARDACLHL